MTIRSGCFLCGTYCPAKPIFVDNMEVQMAFVRSDEAGRFLAFLGDNDLQER